MSKLPDWLHPATLRWLANDATAEVRASERSAQKYAGGEMSFVARSQNYRLSSLAKRLRGIATRIERRRGER